MNFRERVLQIVNQIPKGKVATYGQIAALAGSARGARQVGWALGSLGLNDQNIPWWRVVNRNGFLSIRQSDPGAKAEQKALLEQDGVEVSQEFTVDLSLCRWQSPHTE